MAGKKIIFSEEQKFQILDLYLKQEKSVTYISKLFGTTPNTMSKNLKLWGCEVINKQNLITYTPAEILNAYKKCNSVTKIAKQFKTSRKKVCSILQENGIEVINYQNLTKFNENVFDSINTEEKAYWLGFIFADGYISSRDNSFELSLKGSDSEHLDKFNKFMQHAKNNIKFGEIQCNGKKFKRCRWGVVNKHLHSTLNNLGCTPRKSLTLKFPDKSIFKESNKYSKEELIRHFIRGYFDGDGCISYMYTNKMHTKVAPICLFLGTDTFLQEIQTILNINSHIYLNHQGDSVKQLKFSQENSRILLSYLYSNCNIYLTRKYKRALFFNTKNCRSAKELAELLASENGEDCDVNPVISESSNELSTL